MRLFDFLRSQLIDVIDRAEASGMLACRDLIKGDTVSKGARPIVREDWVAQSFEPRLLNASPAGFYTLKTASQPTLTAPWHWDEGLAPSFRLLRASACSSAVLALMVI
jgi:membrane protease subunit (stomatin/prohibitin family)